MFQDLRVRILGIVENMAYYSCGKCGHKDLIFGRGYTQMMMTQFGIEVSLLSFRIQLKYVILGGLLNVLSAK